MDLNVFNNLASVVIAWTVGRNSAFGLVDSETVFPRLNEIYCEVFRSPFAHPMTSAVIRSHMMSSFHTSSAKLDMARSLFTQPIPSTVRPVSPDRQHVVRLVRINAIEVDEHSGK